MNGTTCETQMFVSRFNDLFDKCAKPQTLFWADFVETYGKHAVLKDKKAAGLLSPAEWPVGDSERKGADVLRVHFAALDLDGVAPEIVTRIRIEEEQLLVTARALTDFWKTYDGTERKPPRAALISEALSGLSSGKMQLKNGNNMPTNYWKIRSELLTGWNLETGYAEEEQVMRALQSGANQREQQMFQR